MGTKKIKCSVILPVSGAVLNSDKQKRWLKECLWSMQKQSGFDWREGEVIMLVGDGTRWQSEKCLDDKEIKQNFWAMLNEENWEENFLRSWRWVMMGEEKNKISLAEKLNFGLSKARGELIARMDVDDMMISERLSWQIKFLQKNPGIDLCGGQILEFDDNEKNEADKNLLKRNKGASCLPLNDEEIKLAMNFYCPLMHPTLMWRRSWMERVGFVYGQKYRWTEDYESWCNFAAKTKMANLNKVLVMYRRHRDQISQRHSIEAVAQTHEIAQNYRQKYLRENGLEEREILKKAVGMEWLPVNWKMSWLKKSLSKNW